MKFGLFYELQLPRPADKEQWNPDDEHRIVQETLEQIEFADRLGYDYVFDVEHHFLEEYSHSSAPEVLLGAVAARTERIRIGHGIVQMPPNQNHPARVAERIATLDLISNGRVEFGTGEGATRTELEGFLSDPQVKKEAWEESTRECLRMMCETPYPGYEGEHFSMPERNVIPKPLQKPHPPVWLAASRRDTVMQAGRQGIGALGFAFETPEEAQYRVERYYELIRNCEPLGKAINPALVTVGNLMCAPTDEEALAKGLRGAQFFGFSFSWTHGPVRHGRDHVYAEFVRQNNQDAEFQPGDEPEDEALQAVQRSGRRGLFIGSTDYVRKNIRKYEDANVDMLLFILQCGDRKHEHIMESLELFAREVMPEFQERHHLQQKWREKQLDGVRFEVNSTI